VRHILIARDIYRQHRSSETVFHPRHEVSPPHLVGEADWRHDDGARTGRHRRVPRAEGRRGV
jgi:hypothetical protein